MNHTLSYLAKGLCTKLRFKWSCMATLPMLLAQKILSQPFMPDHACCAWYFGLA